MDQESTQNIKYLQFFFIHFVTFFVVILIIYLLNIPNYWISLLIRILLYLWGIILILHAFLLFALFGFWGQKAMTVALKISFMLNSLIRKNSI